MTENGKIFLVKNTILNLFSEQEMSIGLSLYIIKDIEQQLTKLYNNIVSQELKEKDEQENINQEKEEQHQDIDMTGSGLTITSFEDIKDQPD